MELYELLTGLKQERLDLDELVNSEHEDHRDAAHSAMVGGYVLPSGELTLKGRGWLELKRREFFCELADKEWRIIRTAHNNVFMRCGPGVEWEGHKAAFAKRGDYERIAILQDYILEHGDAKQKMGVN